GHQLLLQELLLLGGRLELDALTIGEELAEEGVLTLELALGHDAGLLDQRGALRLETLEQPLGEVRVLEGVAAPTERVHLLLELQDGVVGELEVVVGEGEIQDALEDEIGVGPVHPLAVLLLHVGQDPVVLGRREIARNQPPQLVMHRRVDALELADDPHALLVAAVLVVDDRLEDERLREVLVAEEGARERDEVAERPLVLADAVARPARLEDRLEPLVPAALDAIVIEDGVAVLAVTVVGARQLHERELTQSLLLLADVTAGEPHDLLHDLDRGQVGALAGVAVQVVLDGAITEIGQALEVLRPGVELIPTGDEQGEALDLAEALVRLLLTTDVVQGATADEVVAREQVAELVAVLVRELHVRVAGDLIQDHRLVARLAAD